MWVLILASSVWAIIYIEIVVNINILMKHIHKNNKLARYIDLYRFRSVYSEWKMNLYVEKCCFLSEGLYLFLYNLTSFELLTLFLTYACYNIKFSAIVRLVSPRCSFWYATCLYLVKIWNYTFDPSWPFDLNFWRTGHQKFITCTSLFSSFYINPFEYQKSCL